MALYITPAGRFDKSAIMAQAWGWFREERAELARWQEAAAWWHANKKGYGHYSTRKARPDVSTFAEHLAFAWACARRERTEAARDPKVIELQTRRMAAQAIENHWQHVAELRAVDAEIAAYQASRRAA